VEQSLNAYFLLVRCACYFSIHRFRLFEGFWKDIKFIFFRELKFFRFFRQTGILGNYGESMKSKLFSMAVFSLVMGRTAGSDRPLVVDEVPTQKLPEENKGKKNSEVESDDAAVARVTAIVIYDYASIPPCTRSDELCFIRNLKSPKENPLETFRLECEVVSQKEFYFSNFFALGSFSA